MKIFRASFLLGGLLLSVFIRPGIFAQEPVDPYRYLPTLQFDGTDNFNKGEPNYPHRVWFNTTQDANNDSVVDAEDAMENLIRYAIGDSLVDTGRTGLPNRGPNDQRPAVYFHVVDYDTIRVYQYWYYYADNDWVNNHEHDWQYIYVYEQCGRPTHVLLNYHNFTTIYRWDGLQKDTTTHIIAYVEGGSHGFQNSTQDGVEIQFNGKINLRNGYLDTLTSDSIPWFIFSNDTSTVNTIPYTPQPDTFFAGDDDYVFPNPCERCDPRDAPWVRATWDQPPLPSFDNCPAPSASFTFQSNKLSVQCYDSSKNAAGWYWRFGDGNTDTMPNPAHTYDKPGTYQVCLSVTDSCRDRVDCVCDTFSCLKPTAGFQVAPAQAARTFAFTDYSQDAQSYLWLFGDGDTATTPDPTHQYDSTGTYQPCLVVSSGCLRDTLCRTLTLTDRAFSDALNNSIKVYPDPREGTLTFFMSSLGEGPVRLQIFDRLGRLKKTVERAAVQRSLKVSFSPSSGGLYLARIYMQDRVITKKFLWQE